MRDTANSNAGAIHRYSFLKIFADNDGLNAGELGFIERLALSDEQVDENERKVLSEIFAKAERVGISPEVAAEVAAFKKQYGIP